MKSFIPWIGGKNLLAKKIIPMFPDSFQRYIEVFGGGAAVLFHRERHAKTEIYNDLDNGLVNLFRCAKFHRTELQREISGYFNSRQFFGELKAKMELPGLTDIQRAAIFFVVARLSFGANMRTFGGQPRTLSADCLELVEKRLENVVIENLDFGELIKKYDTNDSLFYCDPPYISTERYYDKRFAPEDHLRLKAILSQIQGRFILSYNDSENIRELYRDFKIVPVRRQNNLSDGFYKELIIKNF
ncbi:MAG: DNA adenine methylase [Ruminococcus sp.]|nr:DNA adenine methylase [Ruminococcus sp.]